jgi:HEAT repeat protein
MEGSWWARVRRRLRPTVDSAIDDLRGGNEHRREHASIWVWSRGHGHFGGEERARLIEALTPLATDPHHPVTRAEAVAALVALDANGAVELALTALRDPRAEVRRIVAGQLGPTGDWRVVDALVELLDDADGYVREAATLGLHSQGDPAALEPLRAMWRRERKDRAAKAGAKRAIRALEKKSAAAR